MAWDWLSFGIFAGGFVMLSASKTYQRYNLSLHPPTPPTPTPPKNPGAQPPKFNWKKYIKQIINYCVAYNSSILIVGSLSESYYSSLTMMGNILAISMGYVYALVLVHPFTYSLDKEIKTPFQYFEKRYRSQRVRALCALMAMFYHFSFITLFLWGCTIILCTLLPAMPFWLSILLMGLYSLVGSAYGGYAQTTLTNLVQFVIVIGGVVVAFAFTMAKSQNSLAELWEFAKIHERTKFVELRTNMKIRFTLLNQLVSLPLSWCAVHALLLPNYIRYRSVESKLKSKLLLMSNLPVMVVFYVIILMSGGFACYLFFYGCDPHRTHQIRSRNQTGVFWMYTILAEYAPSLTGIIFASVICYSLMQHSSGVVMCANTLIDEVFRPLCPSVKLTDADIKRVKRLITLALSFVSILYAFLFQFAKTTLLSLLFLFNNSTNSPILGLFLLSAFNPYANAFGAITGFLINLILNYWFVSGALLIYREAPRRPYDVLCTSNSLTNFEAFDFTNLTVYHMQKMSSRVASVNATTPHKYYDFYLSNYPEIHFIFSLPAIWYCAFSVLATFILGSLFSVAYSLVTTRTLDADAAFGDERKHYLYYYKVFRSLRREKSTACADEHAAHVETRENTALLKIVTEH